MQLLRNASRLLFALVLAAAVGCQSDSPTEPSGSPTVTPKPPDPVTTFIVEVSASPGELVAGGETSSNIVVRVRRSDNGQPPPDLTPVTLTTTLGGFGSPNGPNTTQLQLVNGEANAVLFAGDSIGTATVRAVVGPSAGVANVRINEAATFFVGSVEPSVGDPEGGDQVSILGGGFQDPVRVTFNGTAATVLSVTPTRIRVITPSAAAAGVDVGVGETAPVNVSVTINVNEANQDSDTLTRGFTYAFSDGGGGPVQPQVFSVSPASGINEGGDRVTIRGAGFRAPVQVLFGLGTSVDNFDGVEATVESVSDGQIVVRTPAARGFGQNLVNQVVDILIKNLNTGFSTVSRQKFKYGTDVLITAVSLDTSTTGGRTPVEGGFRVLIQGQGFDEPVAVEFEFDDVAIGQRVISVTGTQIVVLAGPAPLPDECPENGLIEVEGIGVVNIETGDGADAAIGFNYVLPRPLVFGISPTSGNPGINATVSGRDFSENVQVVFGDPEDGSSAQVLSRTSTAITVRVPSAPQGFEFITEPCDGNGDGNPGGTRLAPTPISVSVRNLETGCASTLSNAFLLNPPNTTCTGDTTEPPPAPETQCTDGFDNDTDGLTDAADPQCTGPADNSESS
jgi:IPT/TIG domain